MIRATLLTLMLAALGLIAFTPNASASCIDSNPDDDGVGMQNCSLPAGNCKVLVYGEAPGLGSGCSPFVCVRECTPPIVQCITEGIQNCR